MVLSDVLIEVGMIVLKTVLETIDSVRVMSNWQQNRQQNRW